MKTVEKFNELFEEVVEFDEVDQDIYIDELGTIDKPIQPLIYALGEVGDIMPAIANGGSRENTPYHVEFSVLYNRHDLADALLIYVKRECSHIHVITERDIIDVGDKFIFSYRIEFVDDPTESEIREVSDVVHRFKERYL
ncbi:hypothetical protein D7Z54_01670 [Salibacterium salarium]|uniref:Uncharacterized protein n=1 Tax=Salibacterium salarium TaxID=284579 RepID=A0A428NA68_9BACI|nr:hypothetical protein [Salibacterium salarium]RSL35299.1 hypothetical protein D7Z54_01670 [Salibacterium salarium]